MTARSTSGRALFAALAAMVVAACAGLEPREGEGTVEQAVAETLADARPELLVKDPRTLAVLEERGLAFDGVVPRVAYAKIASMVASDLRSLRARDPKLGVGVDHPHRQLDPGWLDSPAARFELVAVVHRLDRLHVGGGCGEVRLVYRLAYRAEDIASRLPMTINVVIPQPDDADRCASVAGRWLAVKAAGPDHAAALLAGPLGSPLPSFRQIEIDYQAARWPSNERPEMGGHAEYVLRVFTPAADGSGSLDPAPLENTPRANLSPEEIDDLRGWIREHLSAIDDGTAVLPAKFLATRAVSVAPRGLARTANRAFTQLFPDPADAFGDLPLAATKQVKSVAALMRRLDTMTCHGCHQARSIAGFHLLGEERDPAARLNALAVGRSPHLTDELGWRDAFLRSVAERSSPGTRAPRPFAERGRGAEPGRYGAHCGLGDPGFASWTCAPGLQCTNVHGTAVGMCLPLAAPIGDACEAVKLTSNPDPHRDRVAERRSLTCDASGRDARCNPVDQGFPDGLCRADCGVSDVGKVEGDVVCGLVPSAAGLTACLAAHRPFPECLAATNTATLLKTCDATEHCRDDYACARVKDGPPGVGACMPPYFAFQVRVDGHPPARLEE